MVHADLICVPQLMSGEQALAAQIGGSERGLRAAVRSHFAMAMEGRCARCGEAQGREQRRGPCHSS
jgi:hypothetical protein